MLKRYRDKYGIDYYEIDNKLTFWENKKHLRKLVRMMEHSLGTWELVRWESLQGAIHEGTHTRILCALPTLWGNEIF